MWYFKYLEKSYESGPKATEMQEGIIIIESNTAVTNHPEPYGVFIHNLNLPNFHPDTESGI